MWFVLFAVAAAEEGCPPITTWMDKAREDLVAGSFEEAGVDLASAEGSMECAVTLPEELGRFWLLQGALRGLTGDEPGASVAFAASRRVAPEGWDPALGEALRKLYDAAPAGSPVTVTVDTNAGRVLLDGERVRRWPAAAESGLVAVQVVGDEPDAAVGHKLVTIPEGAGQVVVTTGLPELPPLPGAKGGKAGVPWLAFGVGAFGAGGGTAIYSLTQRAAAGEAPTIPEADAAHKRQVVSRWTAVGLAGAGVLLSGVGTLVIVF